MLDKPQRNTFFFVYTIWVDWSASESWHETIHGHGFVNAYCCCHLRQWRKATSCL